MVKVEADADVEGGREGVGSGLLSQSLLAVFCWRPTRVLNVAASALFFFFEIENMRETSRGAARSRSGAAARLLRKSESVFLWGEMWNMLFTKKIYSLFFFVFFGCKFKNV